MAYFCDKSGVRVVAPGTSRSAGGSIPEHDGTAKAHAAESACVTALKSQVRGDYELPKPETVKAAVQAAVEIFDTEPTHDKPKPKAKAEN